MSGSKNKIDRGSLLLDLAPGMKGLHPLLQPVVFRGRATFVLFPLLSAGSVGKVARASPRTALATYSRDGAGHQSRHGPRDGRIGDLGAVIAYRTGRSRDQALDGFSGLRESDAITLR